MENIFKQMQIKSQRIDHLGIVAGVIKEIGLVDLVNESIGYDEKQEEISAGNVVAAMILNGLGFVSRPLMLTPQYFENKALDILLDSKVKPEQLNRHKIGRVLDEIYDFGCEKMFSIIASNTCIQQRVNMQFAHADTTSHSVTGEYDSDSDTEKIHVTYGHSKAKRPDLKQVVQELVTSQDGGIPFATKVWSGNSSDVEILRDRAKKLVDEFKKSDNRCLVADSKLYTQETAEALNNMNFITRVPSIFKAETKIIEVALQQPDAWILINDDYKLQEFKDIKECKIDNQRWIVIHSKAARKRVELTLAKEVKKEKEDKIKKQLSELKSQLFNCENDAKLALDKLSKSWKYHESIEVNIEKIESYSKKGRPKKTDTPDVELFTITSSVHEITKIIQKTIDQRSCFVLATNTTDISAEQVLTAYKQQDKTEKGFAFLKSPDFFVSSLFLKKSSRIDGLLMIMVLSLLVYSIAQRKLRQKLEELKETFPNQINKPIKNPTMRWIFQLFEGVDLMTVTLNGLVHRYIQGLNEIRLRVINLLGSHVYEIYHKFTTEG